MQDKFTNDLEVWTALKIGDEKALGYIFDKYVYVLYSYGAKITTDKTLVEDCIQDTFIELWQRHTSLGNTSCIKYYLFKSLRRRIIRKLKQKQKFTTSPLEENSIRFDDMVFSYETQLINQQTSDENREKLVQVLDALSEKQKKIIFLKFYDKLSYEEIADIMSLNIKAVYDLVYHTMKAIKKNFQKTYIY